MVIKIVVDGAPVGKGRPRFVRIGTYHKPYTPEKTANYEAIVAAIGAQAMAGRPPFDVPVALRLTAYMPIRPSWTKRATAAALSGLRRPGKPDLDNIVKTVGDALNQIVWRDDSLIAEAYICKVYDADPRLEIEVRPITTIADVRQKELPQVTAWPTPVQGDLL